MSASEPFPLPPDVPIHIHTVATLLGIPIRRLQWLAYQGEIPIANQDRKSGTPYEFFPRDFERIVRRSRRAEVTNKGGARLAALADRVAALERERERDRRELDFWREKLAPLLEA